MIKGVLFDMDGVLIDSEEFLVVEDAVSGIRAGKAAGCKCLGVTTSFKAELMKEADWICGTLADVPEEIFTSIPIAVGTPGGAK